MPRSDPSRGIFISYRRDDTSGFAGRLYDKLAARYGADRVFMDIDTILPSSDFSVEIERALSSSAASIVLIGRRWVSITKDDGSRRLDDPTDFVRLEVGAALRRGVAVFPVLVDGATPPSSGSLPEDIREVASRHAIELSNERWNYDVGRLILALDEVVQEKGHRRRERPKWPILVAAAVIAVLVAGVGAWAMTRDGTSPAPDDTAGPSDTGGTGNPGGTDTPDGCPSGELSLPEPSGTALEGTYSVEFGDHEITGTPATTNLWSEVDADKQFEDHTWPPQAWILSSTCGTWQVVEPAEGIDTSNALVSQSQGTFSASSAKTLPGSCSDSIGQRSIELVPKSGGMTFTGTLRVTYNCTDAFEATFPVEGSWQGS